MTQRPGRKIGTLAIKLDRKKNRYTWAKVEVELRFEITSGTFYAVYEGNWYEAKTKDDLSEQIKAAATKAMSIEWKRYILIDYEAEGHPLDDEKSGRPATSGTYHTFEIDHDRSKFGRGYDENAKFAINSIKLSWTICEISEPYPLPEDPNKRIRAKREVNIRHYGSDQGEEQIGEPAEWEDDVLPPGTLLWTPEREALLVDILAAIGKLDARLVDLFQGDASELANKIDAAAQTDPSRLLAAPTTTAKPTKRRRA